MKPPVCHLCGTSFFDEPERDRRGALVAFADYRPLPRGMVGHPHGLEWFCTDHVEAAQELQALTLADATAVLKKRFPA